MSALFENRDLVVPGDILYEGRTRTGDNTYRNDGKVSATRIGLVDYSKNMVSVGNIRLQLSRFLEGVGC